MVIILSESMNEESNSYPCIPVVQPPALSVSLILLSVCQWQQSVVSVPGNCVCVCVWGGRFSHNYRPLHMYQESLEGSVYDMCSCNNTTSIISLFLSSCSAASISSLLHLACRSSSHRRAYMHSSVRMNIEIQYMYHL